MKRKFVCVSCPVGCELEVELDHQGTLKVTGDRCPRGEAYAWEEITEPKRVLPTSVKVVGGELPLASVRTDRPIPKGLIPQVMELIKKLSVPAPVEVGQVLLKDLLGTGANLVATRAVARRACAPHEAL